MLDWHYEFLYLLLIFLRVGIFCVILILSWVAKLVLSHYQLENEFRTKQPCLIKELGAHSCNLGLRSALKVMLLFQYCYCYTFAEKISIVNDKDYCYRYIHVFLEVFCTYSYRIMTFELILFETHLVCLHSESKYFAI